jgi:hypothetical protein
MSTNAPDLPADPIIDQATATFRDIVARHVDHYRKVAATKTSEQAQTDFVAYLFASGRSPQWIAATLAAAVATLAATPTNDHQREVEQLRAEVARLSARKQTDLDELKQRLGAAHSTLQKHCERRDEQQAEITWLTSALNHVDDLAERGSRKGYDLDSDDVHAITRRGLTGRPCDHNGCVRVPGHPKGDGGHSLHPLTDADRAAATLRGEQS